MTADLFALLLILYILNQIYTVNRQSFLVFAGIATTDQTTHISLWKLLSVFFDTLSLFDHAATNSRLLCLRWGHTLWTPRSVFCPLVSVRGPPSLLMAMSCDTTSVRKSESPSWLGHCGEWVRSYPPQLKTPAFSTTQNMTLSKHRGSKIKTRLEFRVTI